MSKRVLYAVAVCAVAVMLSPFIPLAAAQSKASQEVEAIIKARLPNFPDEVCQFYDSWSASQMKEGKTPGKGFTVILAIMDPGLNDFCLFAQWAMVRTLEALGCKVEQRISGTTGTDPKDVANVENAIASRPSAVIIRSGTQEFWKSTLKKAQQMKVPIFGCDVWISGPAVPSMVTSDNFDIGLKMAVGLVTNIRGEGNIISQYFPGYHPAEIRTLELNLVAKEFPEVRIGQEIGADYNNMVGSIRDKVAAALVANPKGAIQGIYTVGDLWAVAADDVCRAAGRNEIAIVGVDGDRENLKRLAHGNTNIILSVSQDSALIGAATSFCVVDYLNKKTPPPYLFVPTKLVTSTNAAEVYKEKFGEMK